MASDLVRTVAFVLLVEVPVIILVVALVAFLGARHGK